MVTASCRMLTTLMTAYCAYFKARLAMRLLYREAITWAWTLLIRIGHVPRDELPAFLVKYCPSENVATGLGMNAASFLGAGLTTRVLLTRSSWATVGVYMTAQALLIAALFGGLLLPLSSAQSGQKDSLRGAYEFLMGWAVWGWTASKYTAHNARELN